MSSPPPQAQKRKRQDGDEPRQLKRPAGNAASAPRPVSSASKPAPSLSDLPSNKEKSTPIALNESKPISNAPASNGTREGGNPKPRKRPTNSAAFSAARRAEAQRRANDRGTGDQSNRPTAGVADYVTQHYNNVPERGREWRRTDSAIKGLRSYNNWVKSALLHKCAPKTPGAKVLDIGCGKGGDLMKWQSQRIDLYVGIDPAGVSIDQARERYRGMQRRNRNIFHAEFLTRDGFGLSLDGVPIINQVGFDKNNDQRWGGGGFDIVSMMFCMHYAFENEEKARIMLKNVAGALKKGGKCLGVIPNSDVLSAKVAEEHKQRAAAKGKSTADDDDDDAWDPEKSLDTKEPSPEPEGEEEPIIWGNSIYKVKFPGKTPIDGVFRPPFGWKYFYFLEEAVDEVPEFAVPWEAFRGLAEDYGLELEYRRPFDAVWTEEGRNPELAALSEKMGVRDRNTGRLLVSEEEMDAARFYHAFCFVKV